MTDKDYLEKQLAEVELLSSMYPGKGEVVLDKASVIADVTQYVNGETAAVPKQIALTVKLNLGRNSDQDVFLWTSFPAVYPYSLPEVFVRCPTLTRQQQGFLNQNLMQYLKEQQNEEPCITNALTWLEENFEEYVDGEEQPVARTETPIKYKFTGLSRLWIYSHHIYRKELLKKIPDSAAELDLTGFVLPGKPGIICVEGMKERCDEYWQRLKYPNWKHISCKHREDKELTHLKDGVSVDTQLKHFRIFQSFEELAFEAHGDYGLRNDYHMDLGQFRQYLISHGCEYMFQIFFGLEGK